MAKFNAGDKVVPVPYDTLVANGIIPFGAEVYGIDCKYYRLMCAGKDHFVEDIGKPDSAGVTTYNVRFESVTENSDNWWLPEWALEPAKLTTPKIDFDIPGSVNIMGVEYTVEVLPKLGDDESDGTGGFCDPDLKCIKLRDLTAIDEWKNEPIEKVRARMKMILRHEIVHAYLDESGLMYNSMVFGDGWAKNEEMTDWFAIQGPKIMETWQKAGCL